MKTSLMIFFLGNVIASAFGDLAGTMQPLKFVLLVSTREPAFTNELVYSDTVPSYDSGMAGGMSTIWPFARTWLGNLDRLANGEEVTLRFTSMGCFSQTSRKIVFTKRQGDLEAVLYDNPINPAPPRVVTQPLRKALASKKLTGKDQRIIDAFEKQLREKRPGGCTTTDQYTLEDTGGTMVVTDGSCGWSGFYQLALDLFGSPAR